MKHVRLLDMEKGAKRLSVKEGATLNDVLAAAGSVQGDRVLSQNGHPATGDAIAKPDAMVLLMPKAKHA
jgi:hypothetical protein